MTQGGAPSPPGARLAFVLQQLKQRTGLSLAQLANATTFSKSSWDRYLNGKSLPPRSAVEELCRLAGEPADRSLALLDIARTHQSHQPHQPHQPHRPLRTKGGGPTRGTPAGQHTAVRPDAPIPAPTTTPPDTGPSGPDDADHTHTRPTGHRRATVLTTLASVCAVALGAIVLIHLPPSHRKAASLSPTPTPTPVTGALCRYTACQDKDPIKMKCGAEPLTLAEHETTTGAWIQIRYSQECGTSWARMWGAALDDRVEIRAVGRDGSLHDARVTSRHEADTYVHTLMSVVSPGTSVQACFSPAAGGAKECFTTRTDTYESWTSRP